MWSHRYPPNSCTAHGFRVIGCISWHSQTDSSRNTQKSSWSKWTRERLQLYVSQRLGGRLAFSGTLCTCMAGRLQPDARTQPVKLHPLNKSLIWFSFEMDRCHLTDLNRLPMARKRTVQQCHIMINTKAVALVKRIMPVVSHWFSSQQTRRSMRIDSPCHSPICQFRRICCDGLNFETTEEHKAECGTY